MGQLLRQCSVVLSAVALMFGAAASADWQASSTHNRMVDFGNGMEPIGPQCSLVNNVGHTDLGNVHKRPRGTLEFYIDGETVEYRKAMQRQGHSWFVDNTGVPEPYDRMLVSSWLAPVIQIHGIKPAMRLDDELFYRYLGKSVTHRVVRAAVYEIRYVWTRQDVGSSQVEVRSGTSRVQAPELHGTDEPDPTGSLISAYWVDYPQELYNAYADGTLKSLRIYFPGSAKTNAHHEQPHYVSWDIDLGLEAANKLCECVKTVAGAVGATELAGAFDEAAMHGEVCPAPMAVAPPYMPQLVNTEYMP